MKTEFIALSGKKIKPCNGCGTCRSEKLKGKIVALLIFGYPTTMPQTPEKREPLIFWMH